MAKFHINEKGDAGECSATKGKCPFGNEAHHFTSAEAARVFYEKAQEKEAAKAARLAQLATRSDELARTVAAARKDLEAYGKTSNIFTQWSKIHADFKTNTNGKKMVLVNGGGMGTVLTPWYGPKILEALENEDSIPTFDETPGLFYSHNTETSSDGRIPIVWLGEHIEVDDRKNWHLTTERESNLYDSYWRIHEEAEGRGLSDAEAHEIATSAIDRFDADGKDPNVKTPDGLSSKQKDSIDSMSLREMFREWKFSPIGTFQTGDPYTKYFQKVMLEKREKNNDEWVSASKSFSS